MWWRSPKALHWRNKPVAWLPRSQESRLRYAIQRSTAETLGETGKRRGKPSIAVSEGCPAWIQWAFREQRLAHAGFTFQGSRKRVRCRARLVHFRQSRAVPTDPFCEGLTLITRHWVFKITSRWSGLAHATTTKLYSLSTGREKTWKARENVRLFRLAWRNICRLRKLWVRSGDFFLLWSPTWADYR